MGGIQRYPASMWTGYAFGIEDMIDPRETRPLLVDFVRDAQSHIAARLGPTSRIPYLP